MRTLLRSIVLALPLAFAGAAAADPADSTSADLLRATAAVPWTPPAPVRAGETWETVLRFPGALVSLPLRAVGRATEAGLLYAEDQNIVFRLLAVLAFQRRLGLAVTPASLGDGTGLGGAVHLSPPPIADHLSGELSGSTKMYNRERVRAGAGPLSAVYVSEWRSQDPFVGLGMDGREEDETTYATRSQSARLMLAFPHGRRHAAALPLVEGAAHAAGGAAPARARTHFAVWGGPREVTLTGGRADEEPSFEVNYPEFTGLLHRRIEHLVYGARLSHDARFGRPRWTRGWQASIEAERYDRSIEALALKDAHSDARSFNRFTFRGEGGVSFWMDPRSVRLAVTVVDQRLDDGGGAFLLPDLMRLGGSAGLGGFEPGRFHDVDLVTGRLSYIFPLGKNLEFDWHVETGGVFPALEAARLDGLEMSYGGHLRVRTDEAMAGSVGFEWSREGARLKFSVGGVE